MKEYPLKLSKISSILFYVGWIALWISLYLKHTRGLLYGADILLTLILLFFVFKDSSFFKKLPKFLLILLGSFLFFLFLAVLYSPYPSASFDAFLLNYFFHISLFFLLIYLISNYEIDLNIWISILIINLIINIYYIAFVLLKCHFSGSCFILGGMNLMEPSLLKGLVVTSPVYVFCFLSFMGLFLNLKSNLKYIFCIGSLTNLVFILWLGRRAAIIACIISFILFSFLSSKQIFKKFFLVFGFSLIILISVLINTPYGKRLFIRGEKIKILLSGNYTKFSEAGSLEKRLYIWPIYLKTALKHTFKGTGLARRVQKKVLAEVNEKALRLEHAHNIFLNIWLQAGLQTALIFLVFYLYTIYKAFHLWKFSSENILYGMLLVFLIAFFIMSLFEGMEKLTRFTPFWIASGMVWGYAQRLQNKSSFSS